jgi:hypothetical protein
MSDCWYSSIWKIAPYVFNHRSFFRLQTILRYVAFPSNKRMLVLCGDLPATSCSRVTGPLPQIGHRESWLCERGHTACNFIISYLYSKKDLILNKFVKKKASKKYRAKEFVILYPPILNNVTFIVNVQYVSMRTRDSIATVSLRRRRGLRPRYRRQRATGRRRRRRYGEAMLK